MKILKAPLLAAAASVAVLGIAAFPTAPATAQSAQTVPVEVWALRDVVNAVQVSPDGKHVLVHKVESREGDYLLEIYKTDDLSKPLRRLVAKPMEIISAGWVNDRYIFGTAWQVVRKSVKGPEEDVRERKGYVYDLEKNKFSETGDDIQTESLLPNEPDSIIVSTGNAVSDATGVDPFQAFRPRAYYKLNLDRGSKSLIIKGSEDYPTVGFDLEGNPRVRTSFNSSTNVVGTEFRLAGSKQWIKLTETYDADEHENLYRFLGGPFGFRGFKEGEPNTVYMLDSRGGDKSALWEYDLTTQQFTKKLFETPDADVMGIVRHSIPGNYKLVAAGYSGAKRERHWFDEEEKALHEALESQIPYAHQVRINSRSRDGNTMIVYNSGPRDPGSYWLVQDGKMAKLGSRNPLINQGQLADVEYIRYPARDGKIIPAYVTKPIGEGPFPLVVLPHGGPHVNEVIGYDEWGQLLASAGYMVLQPQYRMSVGWGKEHFDSAYGQHGLAMQDDKDDGALYLVEQGLVDPNRMAMFGWSYGGYAALVAASRENNIYQCAIAGAAVADPEKVYKMRRQPGGAKAIDDWAQRRGMIGINPINEVDKVNIPLLMIHGDWDARVLYFNYKDYKKAMDKAGKTNAQYLTLEGADHFSNTLMYEHQQVFYSKMLDYLANDCGPGGL